MWSLPLNWAVFFFISLSKEQKQFTSTWKRQKHNLILYHWVHNVILLEFSSIHSRICLYTDNAKAIWPEEQEVTRILEVSIISIYIRSWVKSVIKFEDKHHKCSFRGPKALSMSEYSSYSGGKKREREKEFAALYTAPQYLRSPLNMKG